MSRRLKPTLVDYVVIAINPVLIMGLVGSLVYFLLEILYGGAYPDRLQFCLTMFIFAIVLISRISMEDGFERAAPFGIAIAVLVGIALNRFVAYPSAAAASFGWIINWSLMALTWWCAHKLTWDCTTLEEGEDPAGRGLLETAGIEKIKDEPAQDPTAPVAAPPANLPPATELSQRRWQQFLDRQAPAPHARRVDRLLFARLAADFRPGSTLHSRREHRQPPLRLFAAVRLCRLRTLAAADHEFPFAASLPPPAATGDAGRDGGQLADDRRGDGRRSARLLGTPPAPFPGIRDFGIAQHRRLARARRIARQRGERRRSRSAGRQRFGRRPFAEPILGPAVRSARLIRRRRHAAHVGRARWSAAEQVGSALRRKRSPRFGRKIGLEVRGKINRIFQRSSVRRKTVGRVVRQIGHQGESAARHEGPIPEYATTEYPVAKYPVAKYAAGRRSRHQGRTPGCRQTAVRARAAHDSSQSTGRLIAAAITAPGPAPHAVAAKPRVRSSTLWRACSKWFSTQC